MFQTHWRLNLRKVVTQQACLKHVLKKNLAENAYRKTLLRILTGKKHPQMELCYLRQV